ncbi:hypothetical protein TKK_0014468 [Trichogramma kaykai]
MRLSDAYQGLIKEECYDENNYVEIKNQTFDAKYLQDHKCLQENSIRTLKHEKIREFRPGHDIKIEFECKDVKLLVRDNLNEGTHKFQPNQEIKIEFECKDVKPNVDVLVPDEVNNYGSHQYQNAEMNNNFAIHSSIELENESMVKKEFFGDITTFDINTKCEIYPPINEDIQLTECDTRGKTFSPKSYLKLSHSCNKCAFTHNSALKTHIDSVHNHNNHPCYTCGKTFSYMSNLKRHIDLIHKRITYQCDICGKTFKYKSFLKTHINSVHMHNNRKPHNCHICGKIFSQKTHLKTHIDSVHNHINHACPTCGKTFSQKSYLKIHIDSVHNIRKTSQL